jgi:hypothetical protein
MTEVHHSAEVGMVTETPMVHDTGIRMGRRRLVIATLMLLIATVAGMRTDARGVDRRIGTGSEGRGSEMLRERGCRIVSGLCTVGGED